MKKIISTLVGLALAGAPMLALAEDGNTSTVTHPLRVASTTANPGEREDFASSTARAAHKGDLIGQAQDRADQEIQRRITSLNEVLSHLSDAKHVSDDDKTGITATINAQISELSDLQTKVNSDAATTSLRGDIQSITKSYRIYALVMPKAVIAAAASRINSVAASMDAFGAKVQSRISAGATVNTDVTTALADITVHTASAKTQAAAAVSETASLQPDNGDQTLMASNTAALKDARTKIEAAQKELAAARADIAIILKNVKGTSLDTGGHASTSAAANLGASVWNGILHLFGK